MKMEELLNKLIEKGWKPFWNNDWKKIVKDWDWYNLHRYVKHIALPSRDLRLRNFVSKESWLWQFCVENDFIDYSKVRAYWISFAPLEIQNARKMQNYDNIHRLLWDCASLDEDKLWQFLIDIIKI